MFGGSLTLLSSSVCTLIWFVSLIGGLWGTWCNSFTFEVAKCTCSWVPAIVLVARIVWSPIGGVGGIHVIEGARGVVTEGGVLSRSVHSSDGLVWSSLLGLPVVRQVWFMGGVGGKQTTDGVTSEAACIMSGWSVESLVSLIWLAAKLLRSKWSALYWRTFLLKGLVNVLVCWLVGVLRIDLTCWNLGGS